MFRQNSRNFPVEIMNAARIDGLNEFGIFFRIYMPVMKSTYAAAAVITSMNAWNAYLWPRVVLKAPEAQTMPLFIANLAGGYTIDYGALMMSVLFCSLSCKNSLQKASPARSNNRTVIRRSPALCGEHRFYSGRKA